MSIQATRNPSSTDSNFQAKPLQDLRGVRAQCLNALQALADGKLAQASHDVPPRLSKHQRDYVFKTMKPTYFWHQADPSKLRGERMERTQYPNPVFKVMLAQGWIEPTEDEHHIPNMRHYRISHKGKEELESAMAWWSTIPLPRKIWLNITE